jgi:hypothetical protein
MKNNKQEPVQVVLTFNPNEKESLRAKVIANPNASEGSKLKRLDENSKLVRRYSFDDNGGGYLGL